MLCNLVKLKELEPHLIILLFLMKIGAFAKINRIVVSDDAADVEFLYSVVIDYHKLHAEVDKEIPEIRDSE